MRTIVNDSTAGGTVHLFEASGLGQAPYRYIGMAENRFSLGDGTTKPGGSCDFCATGIAYEFRVRSADGRVFVLGSECIHKSGDAGLRKAISRDEAALRAQKKAALDARKRSEVAGLLSNPSVREAAAAKPHPSAYYAGQGRTLLDYFEFVARFGGASGRNSLLKTLRMFLSEGAA